MTRHHLRSVFNLVAALVSMGVVSSTRAADAAHLPLPPGCTLIADSVAPAVTSPALSRVFPSLPLQVRTLFEPRVLASAGRSFLIYELKLENLSGSPMILRSMEVMDLDQPAARTIATFDAVQLNALLRPAGQYQNHPHEDANRKLNEGRSAIAFMCLSFDDKAAVPRQLRHRVHLEGASTDGPLVVVQHNALPVLGPLLEGSNWHPRNGPSLDSHHHMGYLVEGGLEQNGRRFAIDWRKSKDGQPFVGDQRDLKSHLSYGERLFAVADGTVVTAPSHYPDNIPISEAGFETAVPMTTYESIFGNGVVIKLADGQYAQYAHMLPGSVQVQAGDRVHRGQFIGRVGNSGDSRSPHVHFQLATTPDVLASEGLPFVFEQFRMSVPGQDWTERSLEFPWGDDTRVDFGTASDGGK